MAGLVRRYLLVVFRFLPFAISFLRDRRRFLLFGPGRHVSDAVHRERAERIRDTMLELGPAFIKVGQVLSTRPDIVPPTYTDVFGTLQDEIPEGAGGDPRTVLETELGDELDLSTLERVAGGSLAFVYTAVYDGERIAIKVRRPFAEDDRVVVPASYPELCSERVLAMEFLTGRKVTDEDAFDSVDVDPHEMARWITEIYLKMGLVDGVFHADPHPGNLAVTDEGRLLLFDFGMSERLPPTVQDEIVDLYRALVRRDLDGLVDALIALDVLEASVDRAEVRRVLELVVENLSGRSNVTWRAIITELMASLREFPFRIPPDVMLLLRVGTVGEGVCRQLDPEFDFLAAVRTFLLEQGLIESELAALVGETLDDAQQSVPALARLPTRFDRALDQLERGEVVVMTESADGRAGGDPALGYAVLAGALSVTAAVLALGARPYAAPAAGLAVVFLAVYLVRDHG